MPDTRQKELIDDLAERTWYEEQSQHCTACNDTPFEERRDGESDQREHNDPHKRAERDRPDHPEISPQPRDAAERSLEKEDQQTRYPRHQRKQESDHCHLAEHVLGTRKWTAQVQRQSIIRQVAGDQWRRDENREDKRERTLNLDKSIKERGVDRQKFANVYLQQREGVHVVMQIHQNGRDKRIDKAKDKDRREQLRLENLAQGVARYDEKARPCRRRLALVRPVEMLINGHRSPSRLSRCRRFPLPSGKCLRANRV